MREAVAYRIAGWDTPLRVNSNRTAGRFNERGSPATQYLSLHPLGPWAEYLRTEELRDPSELAERRLRIWALRIALDDSQRIDFSTAADFGLDDPEDLINDNHGACRSLANRLRADPRAPRTLIVPSAALPGTDNVVIFGERVQIPYSWAPISAVDIPACVIAERSQPPPKIPSLVRYRGEPHSAFDAWRAGRSYRFPDLARP